MGWIEVILIGLIGQACAAPKPDQVSGTATVGIPPLITLKDGNVGVNFLGFKASAGLGGLLTGDASQGGLHAEAETPFGQKAGAGLGGHVTGQGRSIGGLYAGATAGGGVGAAAGIGGMTDDSGSVGGAFASSSNGAVTKTVLKERVSPGEVAVNIQKIPTPARSVEVVKEPSAVKSTIDISVVKEATDVKPNVRKTYVERTVIPNYVEKTIQVPSFVEKTIRVPTVVEKTVKVPAPPTVIEQEVELPQPVKTVTKTRNVVVDQPDGATVVKTRTKIRRVPWWVRKRINVNNNEDVPYYGGVVAVDYPSPATYSATVRKQYNGDLIRDIFNIPIATLGAVSNLVGNIAGGAGHGTVSVTKTVN